MLRPANALEDAAREVGVHRRRRRAVAELRTGIGLGEQDVDPPSERLTLAGGAQKRARQAARAGRGIVGVVEPDDRGVSLPRQCRGDLRRPLASGPAGAVGAGQRRVDLVDPRPHLADAIDEGVDLRLDKDLRQGGFLPVFGDVGGKFRTRHFGPGAAVELRQMERAGASPAGASHQPVVVVEHDQSGAVRREGLERRAEMRAESGVEGAADVGRLAVEQPHGLLKGGRRRETPAVPERRLHEDPGGDPARGEPVAEQIEFFREVLRLFPGRRPDRGERHHEKRHQGDALSHLSLDIAAQFVDLFDEERHDRIVLQFHRFSFSDT